MILGLLFAGCESMCDLDRSCVAQRNRNNLNKIEIGMSKVEVREIMGKPHQREASELMEWWLYLTNHSAYVSDSERFVPVVFKDGKLAGWGRNYWITQQQLDVKIDHKIEQK